MNVTLLYRRVWYVDLNVGDQGATLQDLQTVGAFRSPEACDAWLDAQADGWDREETESTPDRVVESVSYVQETHRLDRPGGEIVDGDALASSVTPRREPSTRLPIVLLADFERAAPALVGSMLGRSFDAYLYPDGSFYARPSEGERP